MDKNGWMALIQSWLIQEFDIRMGRKWMETLAGQQARGSRKRALIGSAGPLASVFININLYVVSVKKFKLTVYIQMIFEIIHIDTENEGLKDGYVCLNQDTRNLKF